MVGKHFLFFFFFCYFQLFSNYKVLLSWHEHLHSFGKRCISDRTANSLMVLNPDFFSFPNLYRQERREKWRHLWYCNNDFLSTLDSSCRFKHWKTQQCLVFEKQHFHWVQGWEGLSIQFLLHTKTNPDTNSYTELFFDIQEFLYEVLAILSSPCDNWESP